MGIRGLGMRGMGMSIEFRIDSRKAEVRIAAYVGRRDPCETAVYVRDDVGI